MRYDVSDRLVSIEQQLHDVQDDLARTPVRIGITRDTTVSIIIGQATDVVATTDATFKVDYVDLVSGIDPRSDKTSVTETVDIKNTFGQAYSSGEKIIAFHREDNDEWEVEKVSAGSSQLIHFELTQDKLTSDVAMLARTVKSDGTLDAVGSDFYVIDNSARFFGKAAWAVGGTPSSSDRGYRGYAEFRKANYNTTGKAGYDIVEMEQPVMGYLATLTEVTPVTTPKTYNVTTTSLVELEQQGEGRAPKAVLDTLTNFVVEDTKGITNGGTIDGSLIIWSIDEQQYIVAAVNAPPLKIRIKGLTISTVSESTATFAINNVEVLIGEDPRSDTTSTSETITIKNEPPCVILNGGIAYAMYDESETEKWTTADAGNFLNMLKGIGSYSSGSLMGIWNNANDDPEWKALTSEKVVEDYDHPNKQFDTKFVAVFETDTPGTTSITTAACP